jgi:hypothetical protein
MIEVLIFAAITIAVFVFVETWARLILCRRDNVRYRACLRTVYADMGRVKDMNHEQWTALYDMRTKIIKAIDPDYVEKI